MATSGPETSWTKEDDEWDNLDWWEDDPDASIFNEEIIPFCDISNPEICESCQ